MSAVFRFDALSGYQGWATWLCSLLINKFIVYSTARRNSTVGL
jgi:hypothetical protein